jgi:hypothetical protein
LRRPLQAFDGTRRSPAGIADSQPGKETPLEGVGLKVMDQSLGEIAYAAYCEAVGYKSIKGDTLPDWSDQSARLQDAWEAAGEAVANYLEKS